MAPLEPAPPPPRSIPSWAVYAVLSLGLVMLVGAAMAVAVAIRQDRHIEANAATAGDVKSIAGQVQAVKGDVEFLHDFVRRVEAETAAKSEANRRRIEEVREEAASNDDSPEGP